MSISYLLLKNNQEREEVSLSLMPDPYRMEGIALLCFALMLCVVGCIKKYRDKRCLNTAVVSKKL